MNDPDWDKAARILGLRAEIQNLNMARNYLRGVFAAGDVLPMLVDSEVKKRLDQVWLLSDVGARKKIEKERGQL